MNEQTPRAERLHIAFYGRRNSGKSSLINALTGQQSAVVSATPGTTTDPVLKTMEIHGLGPCVLIDTPGFDDEGDLGALRVQQSRKMLDKTDLAVLLLSGAVPQNDEIEWFRLLEARHISDRSRPQQGRLVLQVCPMRKPKRFSDNGRSGSAPRTERDSTPCAKP